MNASVKLLERVLPASVHLRVEIPAEHPSAAILGSERAGSGTLADASGLVLTAHYLILGATRIEVTLADGTALIGAVAAHDFASGIALVKVDASQLPAISLSPSATVSPGADVFLVAAGADNTRRVSTGSVMSIEPFDAYWEYCLDRAILSTAVSPGLGGGAMFDALGRMIGVVSLDLNQIGRSTLAIPAEHFLDHREELLRHGRRVSRPPRAWAGLFCYSVREHIVIAGILPGTPAEAAGLNAGDVVVTLDGRLISSRRTLYEQLWTHRPGETVACTVIRDGKAIHLRVETGNAEAFFG